MPLAATQLGGVHVLDSAASVAASMHCGESVSVRMPVAGAAKARIAAGTATGKLLLLAFE